MFKPLRHRVLDGVARMGEGEHTSVGRIAAYEGVSKSPQLYAILYDLCLRGLLTRHEVQHSNRHTMFTFERTGQEVTDHDYSNESIGA